MITEKTKRKPRARTSVTLIIEREFVGEKTITEAMIPVILEDLRRKAAQGRTLDKRPDSA